MSAPVPYGATVAADVGPVVEDGIPADYGCAGALSHSVDEGGVDRVVDSAGDRRSLPLYAQSIGNSNRGTVPLVAGSGRCRSGHRTRRLRSALRPRPAPERQRGCWSKPEWTDPLGPSRPSSDPRLRYRAICRRSPSRRWPHRHPASRYSTPPSPCRCSSCPRRGVCLGPRCHWSSCRKINVQVDLQPDGMCHGGDRRWLPRLSVEELLVVTRVIRDGMSGP